VRDLFQQLSGKPYRAEDVFGDGLDQAVLYNDLLRRVGGDSAAAEQLIEAERRLAPHEARKVWLQRAIQRCENNPLS
jgi:hypothetical protein